MHPCRMTISVNAATGVGLSLAAALLLAAPVQAQTQLRQDTFRFEGGWFFQVADVRLRVDGETTNGSDIDFDKDVGANSQKSNYLLGAEWRFAPNHRLGLHYFSIGRDREKTLERDITIGDDTYPVGATLKASLDTTVIPVTYSYSFYRTPESELAIAAGLHWFDISLDVSAAIDQSGAEVQRSRSAQADAPLPVIGLRYDRALSSQWTLSASALLFYLKASTDLDYEGRLFSGRVATEYALTKNLALGAALNLFSVSADVDSETWSGRVRYNYWGPNLYLAAYF